jgi:hypothetical protein
VGQVELDAGDRARLRRIEAELAADDPALVGRFRQWEPASGQEAIGPGWSVVPPWVVLVFLVGFLSWTGAPVVGAAVAVIGCVRIARTWPQRGLVRRDTRLWSRDGRGQGTS